jgi:hypothetical protein
MVFRGLGREARFGGQNEWDDGSGEEWVSRVEGKGEVNSESGHTRWRGEGGADGRRSASLSDRDGDGELEV